MMRLSLVVDETQWLMMMKKKNKKKKKRKKEKKDKDGEKEEQKKKEIGCTLNRNNVLNFNTTSHGS